MYKTDQPIIQSYAAQGPDETARVLRFVLLTVRRHLEKIGPMMDDDDRRTTEITRRGVEYVENHKRELYSAIHYDDAEAAMLRLVQVPGLAIVKAGFVVQLARGDIGCLDSHNIKLYGLDAKAFTLTPNVTALTEKIRLYTRVCRELGGPETLWDNWCRYVANLRPKVWKDAESVSRYHVECIVRN